MRFASSMRTVADRFSRFAYGFGRAFEKSYSFLMAPASMPLVVTTAKCHRGRRCLL